MATDTLGQVDDLNATMAADANLTALIGRGAEYVTEAQPDRRLALVHGEITDSARPGSQPAGESSTVELSPTAGYATRTLCVSPPP